MDHKDMMDVIEPALLGQSIPSLTGSKAHVYDLEVVLKCLTDDGLSLKEAYDWVRKMNNQYIGGPNPVFVADIGETDEVLGWTLGGEGE